MTARRPLMKQRRYAHLAFLWGLALAAAVVIPIMIYDKGYFFYYGDFNVQQIPFYRLAHDSILSGNTGWSYLTDLGANFVGSYSFYLLGSPFFWLTMALPHDAVAYAFGPLLMLKLACTSLSAYIYLRRYVTDKRYAVMGGVLYAFSAFSVYNIFFFHFHEAMIAFPLLLAAFDEFHATKRRGVVALAVFFAAVVNYYFFFGQVVFVIIYYVVKNLTRSYRFSIKEFLLLAAESVLGFLMSMFLLLPSIAAITGNYRVTDVISGWNALIYPKTQRYIQILVSFFFPGDVPARNNFTPSAGAKWSSVAAYLPVFSMSFVIGYVRTRKKSFFSRMFLVLCVMALVPVLNSAFQAMNASYYARWFYMLTMIMIVMTVQSLDNLSEVSFEKAFFPTAAVTTVTALLIGLTPEETEDGTAKIGLEDNPKRFWAFVLIAMAGLALTYFLYRFFKKKPERFFRAAAIVLSVFAVAYTETYIIAARTYTDRSDTFLSTYALNNHKEINLPDIDEVRSDFYQTSDNMGMFWQVPTIQCFHSVVPASVMNFYNETGVERDVGSRPQKDLYGLRAFLSVKYLFAEHEEGVDNPDTLMPGFRYLGTGNGFDFFENICYIPMGFTYDSYITVDEYSDLSDGVKHLALLKALVLSQEQMAEYADITGYTKGMYDSLNEFHENHTPLDTNKPVYDGFDSLVTGFGFSEQNYFDDTAKLKENACSSFGYTKDGFEASFTNKGGDNLLFFSVPYDEGWTAYVNGEEAKIEQVDIGFMAVRVDGHATSDIVFRYHTPMLKEGALISACAAAAFIIYMIINRGFKAKRRLRKKYRIKTEIRNNKEVQS